MPEKRFEIFILRGVVSAFYNHKIGNKEKKVRVWTRSIEIHKSIFAIEIEIKPIWRNFYYNIFAVCHFQDGF